MNISFILPSYNEQDSLKQLHQEIVNVVSKLGLSYEMIFINDGSTDTTQSVLEGLMAKDANVQIIRHRTNFGKATALQAGFEKAKGEIIIQMDTDLQDDPKELSKFLEEIKKGADVVVGWKQKRQDSFIKNSTSKFFNGTTNLISKAKLHDHNCGFKAYTAEAIKHISIYGELHRYIAVLASAQGFNITEVPIQHRKREYGVTKYGPSRFIKGFLDLLTVIFITKFKSRPLHFFGYIGITCFSLGFIPAIYLTYIKFVNGESIGNRPLLLLAVMLMIMGVQIVVTGLVGEQITFMLQREKHK